MSLRSCLRPISSLTTCFQERELAVTFTNMDLQGHLGRTYNVNFRLSDKPKRPSEKDSWPASPEENYERLKDAGEVVDVGMSKCSNCDKVGHIAKNCPEDKIEPTDRAVVKCYLCEEVGHRMRDWYVLSVDLISG